MYPIFYNAYPYTDAHEFNFDWIITTIKHVEKIVDDFVVFNKITWAGEWDPGKGYVQWSIVQDTDGNGYISIQPVPANVPLTNTDYWVEVADYNALYAAFDSRITALESTVGDNTTGLVKNVNDINTTLSNGEPYEYFGGSGSGVTGTWTTFPYVTPEMFGAKGDGITDDTTAIQTAINTGNIVKFKKSSTYVWSDMIKIPSYAHLIIDGKIIQPANGSGHFALFDNDNPAGGYNGIHDVLIEGSGIIDMQGAITSTQLTPIRIFHAKNITIKDITIMNCKNYHHIELGGVNNIVIDNIKILGTVKTTSGQFEMIQIEKCDAATGALPYDDTLCDGIYIKNCYFSKTPEGNMYRAIGDHMNINDATMTKMTKNVKIENCTFENRSFNPDFAYSATSAFQYVLVFTSNYENLEIIGNKMVNIEGGAIFINDYFDNVIIRDNYFKNVWASILFWHSNNKGLVFKNNISIDFNYGNFDTIHPINTVGVALWSVNNIIITNNYFKALNTSNTVTIPIHIIPSEAGNITNTCISNNDFVLDSIDSANLLRYNNVTLQHTLPYSNTAGKSYQNSLMPYTALSSPNLNDLTYPVISYCTNATNATGSTSGVILSLFNFGLTSAGHQLWFPYDSTTVYSRYKSSGTWSAWAAV